MGIGPLIKWVDDFICLRFPSPHGTFEDFSNGIRYQYLYDFTFMKNVSSPLGVSWHPTKFTPFSDSVSYHGFEWHLPSKSVSLSHEKRTKLVNKLLAFAIPSNTHSKREVLSILGSLYHASFVYREGRAYLVNYIQWAKKYPIDDDARKDSYLKYHSPHSAITDSKWWLRTLAFDSFAHSVAFRPTSTDLNIWVDASTSFGVGILIDGRWDAWKIRSSSIREEPGRDIGWLEALAIEFTVQHIVTMGFRSIDLVVRSDNQGVIGSYGKGWSHGRFINESLRRVIPQLLLHDISLSIVYVESASNLSDPISRGIFPSNDSHLNTKIVLHSELASLFVHIV